MEVKAEKRQSENKQHLQICCHGGPTEPKIYGTFLFSYL